MLTKRKNKRKIIKWFLVMFLTYTLSGFGQNLDTLKLRAAMIVHSDFEDFFIDKKISNIDKIVEQYEIKLLQSRGVFNCYFFKVNIKNDSDTCFFYIAYSFIHKRLYRLYGFKSNEFNEFYNNELLGGAVTFTKEIKGKKKTLNYILQSISIEEININRLYSLYYNKPQACLIDNSSCYRKSIIINYKREPPQ